MNEERERLLEFLETCTLCFPVHKEYCLGDCKSYDTLIENLADEILKSYVPLTALKEAVEALEKISRYSCRPELIVTEITEIARQAIQKSKKWIGGV